MTGGYSEPFVEKILRSRNSGCQSWRFSRQRIPAPLSTRALRLTSRSPNLGLQLFTNFSDMKTGPSTIFSNARYVLVPYSATQAWRTLKRTIFSLLTLGTFACDSEYLHQNFVSLFPRDVYLNMPIDLSLGRLPIQRK